MRTLNFNILTLSYKINLPGHKSNCINVNETYTFIITPVSRHVSTKSSKKIFSNTDTCHIRFSLYGTKHVMDRATNLQKPIDKISKNQISQQF